MNDIDGQKTLESMSQAGWYNDWLLSQFKKYLQGEILEVGCGIGNFTIRLLTYGQVIAIDINPDYIKKSRKLVGQQASVGFGDIEQNKYFFKNKKFDSVVCLNVLEHIEKDSQALKNLSKLLKPDGKLILLVPSHQALFGSIDEAIGHFRRYDKFDLLKLVQKTSLKIIASRRLNFLGALGWYITGKVLKDSGVKPDKIKLFNLLSRLPIFIERFFEPPLGISILLIARK